MGEKMIEINPQLITSICVALSNNSEIIRKYADKIDVFFITEAKNPDLLVIENLIKNGKINGDFVSSLILQGEFAAADLCISNGIKPNTVIPKSMKEINNAAKYGII